MAETRCGRGALRSLEMKRVGILAVALLSFPLILPGAALEPGDSFPEMEGRTLDNKSERKLPDEADGKPFFAVFVFSREARDELKNWSTALLDYGEADGAAVFQVPVLARAPWFMRGMLRRDIRDDAPESVHDTFFLLNDDYKLWKERLGAEDFSYVYVAAVSEEGRFLGVCAESFSDTAFKSCLRRVAKD